MLKNEIPLIFLGLSASIAYNRFVMDKTLEKQSNNETNSVEDSSKSKKKDSKAFDSAIKAFTMTNKRLHPELYKGNSKVGKVRS